MQTGLDVMQKELEDKSKTNKKLKKNVSSLNWSLRNR